MRRVPPLFVALLAAVLLVALLLAVCVLPAPRVVGAQSVDKQALSIERQLMCPQCVNLRLDVCDTQLCQDMRAEIRTRLAAGESPEQIMAMFEQRYGTGVLANPPYRSFRRVLLGWAVVAMLVVAAGGGVALVAMRRGARPPAVGAADGAAGDDWLDEQLTRDREAR